MRSQIVLSIILALLILPIAAATPQETLQEYFNFYSNEDLNGFLSVHYLEQFSPEIIEWKKNSIQETWNVIDVQRYSIYNIEVSKYKDFAIVYYTSDFDLLVDDMIFSDTKDMGMIMTNDNGWKVVLNAPKTSIQGIMLDYVGNQTSNETDEIDNAESFSVGEVNNDLPYISGNGGCKYDKSYFSGTQEIPEIDRFNDKIMRALVDNDEYFIVKKLDHVEFLEDNVEYDYTIKIDGCTMNDLIEEKITFKEAYDAKKISIEAENAGTNTIINTVEFFVNLWQKLFGEKPQYMIEAESGLLENKGMYSFIGTTSRGTEAYLGTGGATLTYNFNALPGKYELSMWLSDDGVHKDGARSVEIDINGRKYNYNHKSENYPEVWREISIGEVKLDRENTMVIKKTKQTSAAFVMDKFLLK